MDPCCRKYQLDYILRRNKWRNSITNVEANSTFSSIGSDHRIVSSKVRLSLRANRKKLPRKLRYNWPLFKYDMSLQEKYAIEIKNRFILQGDEDISDTYERFIDIIAEVTRELVPLLIKTNKMCPSTENTVSRAREDTRISNREYEDNPDNTNQHNNTESRNKLYTAYTHIAVDTLEEKIKQIENADINRKFLLSWELINEITGRKTTQKGMIKGKNQKERLQTWYKHFQDLLGKPPNIKDENETIIQVIQHLQIKCGAFEMYEYKLAKYVIKEGKSCGVDEIRPEVLKRCNIDDIILAISLLTTSKFLLFIVLTFHVPILILSFAILWLASILFVALFSVDVRPFGFKIPPSSALHFLVTMEYSSPVVIILKPSNLGVSFFDLIVICHDCFLGILLEWFPVDCSSAVS